MRHARPFAALALVALAAMPVAWAGDPLRSAVDGTFAPHAMPRLAGGVEGFNIDLANEIARRMGRGITIDAAQFSGLLPALQAGTYDFIAAPTTVTQERAQNLLFTEGYLDTDYQFVLRSDGPDMTGLQDLRGKTVAVNRGSVYDGWARNLEAEVGWTVESFGTNTDAIQAVLAGRADANVGGNTVSAWAVKTNPRLKLGYLHKTGLVWAAPLRYDSADLRVEIENAIECMKIDGTVAALHEKWFGTKPLPGAAAVTVFPGTGVPGMPGYDATPRAPVCS
jgi:polar amino acid transport system substrate-binding protein